MAENTTFGILIKAILNEFKQEVEEGVVVNIEVIKTKLKAVLSLDKSFYIELLDLDKRNDKTLKILRYFFEVKSIRQKIDKKVVCKYSIGNLNMWTKTSSSSYIGKVRLPFCPMKEHSDILHTIEINSLGYPSFWD